MCCYQKTLRDTEKPHATAKLYMINERGSTISSPFASASVFMRRYRRLHSTKAYITNERISLETIHFAQYPKGGRLDSFNAWDTKKRRNRTGITERIVAIRIINNCDLRTTL
eukprot:UN32520